MKQLQLNLDTGLDNLPPPIEKVLQKLLYLWFIPKFCHTAHFITLIFVNSNICERQHTIWSWKQRVLKCFKGYSEATLMNSFDYKYYISIVRKPTPLLPSSRTSLNTFQMSWRSKIWVELQKQNQPMSNCAVILHLLYTVNVYLNKGLSFSLLMQLCAVLWKLNTPLLFPQKLREYVTARSC